MGEKRKLIAIFRQDYESHPELVSVIQSLPDIVAVKNSPLYSLQTEIFSEEDITHLILVNMGVRYDDTIELLTLRKIAVIQLHTRGSGLPDRECDFLRAEKLSSLDDVVQYVKEI